MVARPKESIAAYLKRNGRGIILQAAALLSAVLAVAYFIFNAATNLENQGIATGFGFLNSTAGFDIIQHYIDYDESSSYGRAFLVALINTLVISALGIVLATILGFGVGIARLSSNWLVAKIAMVYVETLRNIPLLLQIFFWYFAVLRTLPPPRQSIDLGGIIFLNIRGLYVPSPSLTQEAYSLLAVGLIGAGVAVGLIVYNQYLIRQNKSKIAALPWGIGGTILALILTYIILDEPITWSTPSLQGFDFEGGAVLIPEFVALLTALATYTASFIAEIVRAGLIAVDKGQKEAAASLGLSWMHTLRFVVIPQAMRIIIPPLSSQYLNLTKNSSLAAAIAYPDIVLIFSGIVLMQTGQAVEVVTITMAVYLAISLTISLLMNWYNHRTKMIEN